jgi:uncharacterized protein YndB with AHSA1/START domain
MRMLKRILATLFLFVVALTAIAFVLPQTVTVERSVVVNAPPEKIMPYLTDFRKFNEWSPWASGDPETIYEFSGPESGEGAKMSWKSRKYGDGSQVISGVDAPSAVYIDLDLGPNGQSSVRYELSPADDGTIVIWGFEGEMGSNPVRRWFGLMLDGMLGAEYERGLARLKSLVETGKAS